ncbi:MFS transporter [Streptomyces flavofungini]|uniref:MFS transporter n=1 Tax=Streptomyces flavofungini TaxID=68200 RepID=A0ABS0XH90_9ACTN|nr:MFS transporter [Streptomyces flavofungini]MBJ3812580.1 MFS transporter [Streptomyces flavofungini]GHC87842.1 putative ABC transport system membrane protein [Streptomyces flavofungini]
MTQVWARARTFEPAVQLLFVNQFSINLGFYMLMPYLAAHLSGQLGLAAWAVGLVLGVRNLSQQGMFLVGGALADRLGYKPMIVAGCALRTGGFAALAFAQTLPVLIAASAATGLAGALFNPAVRAYVAAEAGPPERRVEAFALFNVFYQTGILVGPLVGLALTGVDFKLTCAVAAVLFALLSVVQVLRLPGRRGETATGAEGAAQGQWRAVFGNRPFWLFSLAMTGSYVLSFQVYLALPLEMERLLGGGTATTVATGALFVVSGLVALVGQLRITDWCKRTWTREQCLVAGLALMGAAFLPPALGGPGYAGVAALLLCAAALAAANAVLYPFEMDTVVSLARERWVATHYGLYNTVCGIGITAGNLAMGALLDVGESRGLPAVPWLVLAALGVGCAWALRSLGRSGRLAAPVPVLGGDAA